MLLDQKTLKRIADGSVSLAFRRWKRPTVKAGGTLLTTIGQLRIKSVAPIEIDAIDEGAARAAGYDDVGALVARLEGRAEGDVYRIELDLEGPDPRISLRERLPEGEELDGVLARLARWSWAPDALRLIDESPAVRAADLASRAGMETSRFKANVRRLKSLGLTESLEVGYRISPRGRTVLEQLEGRPRST